MTKRTPLTPSHAYLMGFRHVADLAAMNRIADRVRGDQSDARALELMDAWRQGAMAAKAMLEKETATLQ